MGILNCVSGNSTWRGLDYYKEKKVVSYRKLDDFRYEGKVSGSHKKVYHVLLDTMHPRSSKCDCPHADGKRVVCKHIVALYFTIFPDEVDRFLKEVEEAKVEYANYEKELYQKIMKHIKKMSKGELQAALIHIFDIGPEWIYDDFVRSYVEFK